jgi:hypothetical protein
LVRGRVGLISIPIDKKSTARRFQIATKHFSKIQDNLYKKARTHDCDFSCKKTCCRIFRRTIFIFFLLFINIKCYHVVLTVTFHAHCQALLETTMLAPVPVILVNLTVACATALVAHLLPAPDKNRVRLHTVETIFHLCTIFKN